MTFSLHSKPRTAAPASGPAPAPAGPSGGSVAAVQRGGVLTVAVVLLVFGVLGFADVLDYFSTDGGRIAGLSSNGLLSTVPVVTAAVLVAGAARSARTVSTVMLVVGTAFLLSALVNLAVLDSTWNLLAFSMANVIFSVCAGLVLLTLGAYGRVSGALPEDSPYRKQPADADLGPEPERYASTPAERAIERDMREAEIAVMEHRASPDQARRVAAMAQVRTRADRRQVWVESGGAPVS